MTSLTPSIAERNRAAAALNIAVTHLVNRDEKRITARQVAGRLVWTVKSQTDPNKSYTVTRMADGWEADTCSCEDQSYRHMCCKHQRAVNELSPVPQPALAPRKVRRELVEEI
jgi:hypothetical protein